MIRLAGAALAVLVLVSAAPAAELERCRTSIAGEVLDFAYDPDRPALKDSLSLRERLIGARGAITCPGLVTLRALTPELTDAERAPFCLQWDGDRETYIGYDIGERDAWLGCRTAKRRFCERVQRSKDAATRWGSAAKDLAVAAGTETALHAAGVVSVQGPAAVIGEKLVALGASALSGVSVPAAVGAAAVTAVAVGGAIYVCSDSGAEGATLRAEPGERPRSGQEITETAPGALLPVE